MAAGVVRSNVDGWPWMSCSSSILWKTAWCSCSALNEPGLQIRLTRSLECTELLLQIVSDWSSRKSTRPTANAFWSGLKSL